MGALGNLAYIKFCVVYGVLWILITALLFRAKPRASEVIFMPVFKPVYGMCVAGLGL